MPRENVAKKIRVDSPVAFHRPLEVDQKVIQSALVETSAPTIFPLLTDEHMEILEEIIQDHHNAEEYTRNNHEVYLIRIYQPHNANTNDLIIINIIRFGEYSPAA